MASSATRTLKVSFNEGPVLGFKDCQAGVKQFAPGDNDHVEPWRDLVTAKNLSNQTFSAVSLDRAAELLRGGHPEATRSALSL
jgi:hypothetical protein